MPTKREREYYAMGFRDGQMATPATAETLLKQEYMAEVYKPTYVKPSRRPKRKLSAWNKFVRANSKKKIYQYANGKLKLKKMGIAFRKKRR